MVVSALNNKSEFDAAIKDNSLVFIDCFATWCGPCRVIAPVVESLSKTYTNTHFYKLDVDEVSDVAQELGIRAMPTFVLFKDGEKSGEVVGASAKAIEAAIQTLGGVSSSKEES
ncbi:hypothetical protein FGG08_000394 [Glutinoglossum americanum]|uniref:Thioredoxin n=1 Tax=Glutinoglossum americanum TaxID=1670608 RepID=A0A9P8L1C7_9PEZI|nr:hypothetical protein FGG08_000394 [Glutinoglossum americanum]